MEQLIAFVIAVVTGLTGLAALSDKGPVKWFLSRVVTSPIEEALDRKIDERLTPTVKQVSLLYTEVHPNGGSSLRDAINRTERMVGDVDSKVDRLDTRVGRVEGAIDVLARRS